MMFCPNCRKRLDNPGRFCDGCGAPLPSLAAEFLVPAPPIEEQSQPMPYSVAANTEACAAFVPAADLTDQKEESAESLNQQPFYSQVCSDTMPIPTFVEEPKPQKKKKTLLWVVIPLILGVVGAAAFFVLSYLDKMDTYDKAHALMEEGEHDEALACFEELEDFKDSAKMVERIETMELDYEIASELLEDGDVEEALEIFKSLGNYADSQAQAARLEELEKQYLTAQKLLDDGQEEEALAQFKRLEGYRDSAKKVEELEALEQVYLNAKACIDNGFYGSAMSVLEGLGDYKDSAQLLQTCTFDFAMELLKQGSADQAFSYETSFTEEQKQVLYEEYNKHYADPTLLDAMEDAIDVRFAMAQAQKSTSKEVVQAEYDILLPYQRLMFRDAALEQLYNAYIDALDRQWSALDYSGEVEDTYEWNWGMAERFVVYDTLNEQYHFLEENQNLLKEYVGYGEYYTARAAISEAIYRDSYESGENAYTFYNSTEYDYDLVIYIECYKGNELVYTGPEEIVHVGKGETVLLQYSSAPDNVDCDYVSPIAIWKNVYRNGKFIEEKE